MIRAAATLFLALTFGGVAWAQSEPTPVVPIPVSDIDKLSYERFNLLEHYFLSQREVMRLSQEAELRKEYEALNDRFKRHYNLNLRQIEQRPDGTFVPVTK